MTFGDRLRAYREARGLTQADVAIRLGVQPSNVSHWERGGRAGRRSNMPAGTITASSTRKAVTRSTRGTPRWEGTMASERASLLDVNGDKVLGAVAYGLVGVIAVIRRFGAEWSREDFLRAAGEVWDHQAALDAAGGGV